MEIKINDLGNPIIAAAIHGGHTIRHELFGSINISENVRLREEDPFTSNWLSISPNKITTRDSKFEVDLDRVEEKATYLTAEDASGLKVWKEIPPKEIIESSMQKYHGFYKRLEQAIDKLLRYNSHLIIYDLHSYNYQTNGPYKAPESNLLNPELNLGTRTMNRNKWAPLVDRFIDEVKNFNFLNRTLDIRENEKFGGGYFAQWIHQKYPESVCCLSIEFRKFFMDEWTGEPDYEIINEIEKLLKSTSNGLLKELNNYSHTIYFQSNYLLN